MPKDNFFELIGGLVQEIKNDGRMGNIIAKRMLSDYDSTVDYSKHHFLCPFHNDKHIGNFDIKRNRFHCYACGEEGSIIDFVMKFDGLDFTNAVIEAAYDLEIIDENVYKNLHNGKIKTATYIKKQVIKEVRNQIADIDTLDKIYSLFSKGAELLGKNKLSKVHYNHLCNTRNLTPDEINERGFFTFPSIYVLGKLIKAMDLEGLSEETLYHVPGFFTDVKKGTTTFQTLRNNSGIGIPIRDVNGKIRGIQIRLDTIKEGEQRYIWFSSSFAVGKDFQNGTSPGTPVSVVYPQGKSLENLDGVSGTIFITEGYFKAIRLANEFNSVALSVQGVHNWRDIPFILDELKKSHPKFRHVYIAYDADMSYKPGVLQPAIKLGLSLTNLNFADCKTDVENILTINRKDRPNVATFYNAYLKVDQYLRANAGSFKFNITYCIWNSDIGKGIDDFIDAMGSANLAVKDITKVQLIQFWDCTYHYLRENDKIREERMLRDGLSSLSEVELEDEVKRDNFEKIFLGEIKFLD